MIDTFFEQSDSDLFLCFAPRASSYMCYTDVLKQKNIFDLCSGWLARLNKMVRVFFVTAPQPPPSGILPRRVAAL